MSSLSDRHDFTESLKADCSIAGLKLFIDCPKNIFVSDGIIAILIFLGFMKIFLHNHHLITFYNLTLK